MRTVVTAVSGMALLILAAGLAAAQVQVSYLCSAPRTGSPCAHYNWYVCWPDSNTATLAVTTTGTVATITHRNAGERVRVEGVDARNRVGRRSFASLPWSPVAPPPTSPHGSSHGHGWGHNKSSPLATAVVYPNPFNPAATVFFELLRPGRVSVDIYDVAGERVRRLLDADLPAGPASALWDGRDDQGLSAASGSYFCRLDVDGAREVLRMLLVK